MNCHFPQSYLAAAESHFIAATDEQFIVPTDGSPLRGLIQDHVDAGVKLTQMNTFIEKEEYQQLLFAALGSLPGLELIRSDADIELMPPAIRKPKELWTGKLSFHVPATSSFPERLLTPVKYFDSIINREASHFDAFESFAQGQRPR
jgi:DNA-directed RNA polymerase beta' subunit